MSLTASLKPAPASGPAAPAHLLQRKCACGNKSDGEVCEACQKKSLQRKANAATAPATVPPSVHQTLAGSGAPLDRSTRTHMEERFGQDFSGVRIHTDALASNSAREVSAQAYTVGQHIAFANGSYDPHGASGQRLLAHELTHTLQQPATTGSGIEIGAPNTQFERDADAVADRVAAGTSLSGVMRSPTANVLQRQPAPAVPAKTAQTGMCRIHFKKGTEELNDPKEFDRCMKDVQAKLKTASKDTEIKLYGYASEEGTTEFNQDLSERRAKKIEQLFGMGNIPKGRMKWFGEGEDKTFPALEENRRVEVVMEAPAPVVKPTPTDTPKPKTDPPKPKEDPPKPKGPAGDRDEDVCKSEGLPTAAQRASCAGEVSVYRTVLAKMRNGLRDGSQTPEKIDEVLTRVYKKLGDYIQDHKMQRAFATWENASDAQKRCNNILYAIHDLRAHLRGGVRDATDADGSAWTDAIGIFESGRGDVAKLICFLKYSEKKSSLPANPGSFGSRCDFIVYQSDDKTFSKFWKGLAEATPLNIAVPFGKTTTEGFGNVIAAAAANKCSCISSIEFWGHGSPGAAFSARMSSKAFDIPGLDKHGPDIDADVRSEWLASLNAEQQAYVKLRDLLCRPDGSLYYRTCRTFAGKEGAEFAERAVRFWQVPVSAHPVDIDVRTPDKRTLRPCEHAYWSTIECPTCGDGKK